MLTEKSKDISGPEVHDLLKLMIPKNPETEWKAFDRSLPEWAKSALKRMPWAVVCRGQRERGIPAGIRGNDKRQRFRCIIQEEIIEEIVTPEQVLKKLIRIDEVEKTRTDKPWSGCIDLLRSLTQMPYYGRELKSIGIGGSAGFEIATGCQVTSKQSDLDLILKISRECDRDLCYKLWQFLKRLPVRVDSVLVTDLGWISLEEYIHAKGKFLVKTAAGYCMSEELWKDESCVSVYGTGVSAAGNAPWTSGLLLCKKIFEDSRRGVGTTD